MPAQDPHMDAETIDYISKTKKKERVKAKKFITRWVFYQHKNLFGNRKRESAFGGQPTPLAPRKKEATPY